MDSLRFLIVEDSADWRSIIKEILMTKLELSKDYVPSVQIEEAEDRPQALHILKSYSPHIAIIDNQLKNERDGGTTLIRQIKEKSPEIIVIMVTTEKSSEVAASVISAGAFDYIVKPHIDDQLRIKIAIATRMISLEAGVLDSMVVGESPIVKAMRERIRKAAAQKGTVMINGDTGTGKSLIAKTIHRISLRSSRPFVGINCAAIPGSLFESEFFGYKKGAHSLATSDKPGVFEQANGGVLFLDEIGEIPYEFQAKLLSALDSGIIRPLGAIQDVKVDVRIIVATNQYLLERIQQKLFREDLFYRINGFPIHVPSLASRKDDIAILVRSFLVQEERYDLVTTISKDAIDYLISLPWPGNVRQLQTVIKRAIAETDGNELTVDTLRMVAQMDRMDTLDGGNSVQDLVKGTSDGNELTIKVPLDAPLARIRCMFEKIYIEEVLKKCDGNVTKTAQVLGIARQSLHEKRRIWRI